MTATARRPLSPTWMVQRLVGEGVDPAEVADRVAAAYAERFGCRASQEMLGALVAEQDPLELVWGIGLLQAKVQAYEGWPSVRLSPLERRVLTSLWEAGEDGWLPATAKQRAALDRLEVLGFADLVGQGWGATDDGRRWLS
ncbi:MAG TPA: hypothetical protein VFA97_01195 [Gaiellaceae bacterium]|nr:hypothetical protein [Gaiellaceae bacterium]